MRDEQEMTFEQIAVLLQASKQGVIGAYDRGKKQAKGDAA